MKHFNPSSTQSERARQAWQILVGAAMNRQTLTYEGLSIKMFQKAAAGVLDKILGHVAYYCEESDLPVLTAIVVGKNRGTPGEDIPLPASDFDAARERVFGTDWFDIVPPSAEELDAAYRRRSK